MSPVDLSGKVAIVTGGAQGIGHAIAEALLRRGCKVCIADILQKEGEAAAKELNLRYGADRVMFSQCDVTKEAEFRATFENTIKKLGPVYILANNAGIARESDWEKMININMIGIARGIYLGFEYMAKDKGGHGGFIINTASQAGFTPVPELAVYAGTKYGVLGMSKSFGMPLYFDRTGVEVKALCPTAVNTELLREVLEVTPNSEKLIENFPPVEPHYVAEGFLKLIDDEGNGTALFAASDGYRYV